MSSRPNRKHGARTSGAASKVADDAAESGPNDSDGDSTSESNTPTIQHTTSSEGDDTSTAATDHDEQVDQPMTDSIDTLPDSTDSEADSSTDDQAAGSAVLGTDEWWNDFDDLSGNSTTESMYSVVYPSTSVERSVALETLWFRLADQGFSTTGLVPVPDVTGTQALEFARRLAQVGASITGQPIRLVEAMQLAPADAQVAVEVVADAGDTPMLVVVDSPTFDTAAIPVLRSCARTVLLVGLGDTETDNLVEITSLVGADQVAGAVCVERAPARRFWQRKPRRAKR